MILKIHPRPEALLGPGDLEKWREIPSTVLSDELNRSQGFHAGIKRIGSGRNRIAGPALTAKTVEGDGLAVHHAAAIAGPHDIIVVEATGGGYTAVWGAFLHRTAEFRKVAGVIIDGYVRDHAELERSEVACFARGLVSAGARAQWGGEINCVISAGGRSVQPGDLIIADEDGIVVAPCQDYAQLYQKCRRRLDDEDRILRAISEDRSTVDIFRLPQPD